MSDLQKERNGLIVASLLVIAMVAIGIVLLYARSVLIPFVLAVFISLLISPILDFQTLRLKIPRIFAVTITVIIVLIILAVLFLFLSQAIQSVVSTAGQYSDSFVKLIELALQKFETWGLSPDQDEIVSKLQNRVPGLITNAFGTGKSLFYLTVLDEDEWENDFRRYSFWDGRGYLKADNVDNNGATITVYSDRSYGGLRGGEKARISSARLNVGEESPPVFMPGFDYCLGNLKLKLRGVEDPDTLIRLNINEEYYELRDGEKFLDDKCSVRDIKKYGLNQETVIRCSEEEKRGNLNIAITTIIELIVDGITGD